MVMSRKMVADKKGVNFRWEHNGMEFSAFKFKDDSSIINSLSFSLSSLSFPLIRTHFTLPPLAFWRVFISRQMAKRNQIFYLYAHHPRHRISSHRWIFYGFRLCFIHLDIKGPPTKSCEGCINQHNQLHMMCHNSTYIFFARSVLLLRHRQSILSSHSLERFAYSFICARMLSVSMEVYT